MHGFSLALYNRKSNALEPWRGAGYRCIAVVIQNQPGVHNLEGIEHVGADIPNYLPPMAALRFRDGIHAVR
jgi:hypothetical protein